MLDDGCFIMSIREGSVIAMLPELGHGFDPSQDEAVDYANHQINTKPPVLMGKNGYTVYTRHRMYRILEYYELMYGIH